MRGINAGLLFVVTLICARGDVAEGIQAFHQGRYADAQKILSAFPNDADARAFEAMALAATGGCGKAEPELSRQVASTTASAVRRLAGIALTECLIARKDYTAAMETLSRLQRDYPKDADLLYETARANMRAWNEAVFELFKAAPDSYRVNQISAEVYETQGRYSEAIAEYRKAIEKNPAAINLHFRLGRALLMESHEPTAFEEAQKAFEAELKLNPSDATAVYEIGQILTARGRTADATVEFQKAVDLRPDFPEALVTLGKAHMQAKRYTEAVPLLQRAITLQPRMESAHYSLMMAYRNLGRNDDALREKATLEQLQKPPEGEFTEFLKKLGEKPAKP